MNEISDEDIVRMFHSGNGEEKAFRLLVGSIARGFTGISVKS